MKIKLLKKVRKRFSVVEHPNGRIDCTGEVWAPMFVVDDTKRSSGYATFPYDTNIPMKHPDNDTREEAFEKAWEFLTKRIHNEYAKTKHKPKKISTKKVKYPIKKIWPIEEQPVKEEVGLWTFLHKSLLEICQ